MRRPLVSVIVPVYNVEKYLKECLDSVAGQTYRNLEIILVDDGSTDNSGVIVDEYKKKTGDKRIKIMHKKNGGLSSARNAGMKHTNGEYIVFVDSDDYIDKAYIEKLYNIACREKADIVACSFKSYSYDNSILKKSPIWPEKSLRGVDAIEDAFKNKRPSYICLCLYKTSLFKDNDILFPEGQDFEDIPTKIKLLYHANNVAFTNEKLYYYQIRNNSITGANLSEERYNDFLQSLADVRDYLSSMGVKKKYRFLNYFEFYSMNTLMNYLARDKQDKSNKKYWKKIRSRMKKLFPKTVFPSTKRRAIGALVIVVSSNRNIYSWLYKRFKSGKKR